jgi:hypothetical protein
VELEEVAWWHCCWRHCRFTMVDFNSVDFIVAVLVEPPPPPSGQALVVGAQQRGVVEGRRLPAKG